SSFESKEVCNEISDFVSYFNCRYKTLEKMLHHRQELQGVTSIKRSLQQEKERVSVIGIVKEIRETKNHNLFVMLEDPSGEIGVIFT
ncbi:hypothetical protein IL398_24225, partial [Escherichia coli]|nr:hypothetical protein [Escherichia coli]